MKGGAPMELSRRSLRGTRTLHLHVASTASAGRVGVGVVLVDPRNRVVRRVTRVLERVTCQELGVFRAILWALWNSRRHAARSVVIHVDDPQAVAQLNGEAAVHPTSVGPYLEIRALIHTYDAAKIQRDKTQWRQEASVLAQQALLGRDARGVDDLPLWAAQQAADPSA